jgi:uncharacterized protein (TIGR02996 family)
MPLTHEDAFLQAVRDDPDDDAPRLVYADWLEERGDVTRAEFIRVQCELERLAADDARRPALVRRQRLLMLGHEAEWAGPLPGLVSNWQFCRGFVERVTVEAQRFLRDADALLDLAPIRTARLLGVTPGLCRELALSRHLGRLAELDLLHAGGSAIAASGAEALVRSPYLANLAALRLHGHHLGNAGARAVAGSPSLAALTALDLGSNDIGDLGAESLAVSQPFPRLKILDLYGNRIGPDGARFLARSANLPELVALNLSTNQLGDLGAAALAASPYFSRLATLNLRYNAIGPEGVAALANSHGLRALTTLLLAGNGVPDEQMQALRTRFGAAGVPRERDRRVWLT